EPAWTFGQRAAEPPDGEPDQRTEEEPDPPAEVHRQARRVEEHRLRERADERAEPVRAVDRQIRVPAVAGGDELVDRRVDRGVLAADPGAGEEAEDDERRVVEREGSEP